MKISLSIDTVKDIVDIKYIDAQGVVRQGIKVHYEDELVWRIEKPPKFISAIGQESGLGEVTLSYEIEDAEPSVTKIEYDVNKDADWQDIGHTNLVDDIVIGSLSIGNVYTFRVQASNEIGETVSGEIYVFVSGEFIAWSEDFESVSKVVDDLWRDPNNNDAIAGGNVTIREKEDTPGKLIQISYIAWNQGNGCFPGTRRLTHPFSYFHLPTARAYELSVDWYFETIWDWNTIGRDREEMKARLLANGRFSDGQKILYTEQSADDYLDTIIGEEEEMEPTDPYFLTGFPYQAGKLHGLISAHDESAPTGSNIPAPNEWSVRTAWVKDIHTHPTQDGFGVYTDGANPAIPPKLAMYIYDQDDIQKYIYLQGFDDIQLNNWYTFKLFVQINDFGKHNGIAKLTVLDRETQDELGSVYVDNLMLHNVQNDTGFVHRLDFDTFFGGGNIRYQPQIDPDWAEDDLVDVNSGVYARNDNFIATRFGALGSLIIENVVYGEERIIFTASHSIPFSQLDGVEYNIKTAHSPYDPDNWYPVVADALDTDINIVDGKAVLEILDDYFSDNYEIYFRVVFDDRKGARSDSLLIDFPTEADIPVITDIIVGDGQLTVQFTAPEDNGNSPITDYEYRLDGGTAVSMEQATTADYTITGVTNGVSYQVEIRAVNAIGAGGWSVPVSEAPQEIFGVPSQMNDTDLLRYYDPLSLVNISSPSGVDVLPDGTGHANMVIGSGDVPTYIANVINGQPVLRFANGVQLQDDGTALNELTNEMTIIVVSSSANIQQFGSIFATFPWETSNILNVHLPYYWNNEYLVSFEFGNRSAGGRLLEPYPVNANEFHVWEFRVKSEHMDILLDGVLIYSKEGSSSLSLVNTVLRMGWSPDGSFIGDFAVGAIYKRFIDTVSQKRVDILNYLSDRFDIECTLPTIETPTITSFTLEGVGQNSLTYGFVIDAKGSPITSIEYELDGSDEWDDSEQTSVTGLFTVQPLTQNQQYSTKIRVSTEVGTVVSNAVLGTPQVTAPTISQFSLKSKTTNSITVEYSINDNGSALSAVEYQFEGGSWNSLGTGSTGEFTRSALNQNTGYDFRLQATNAGGTTQSSVLTITTNNQSQPLPPPTPRAIPAFSMWDAQYNSLGNIIKAQGVDNALTLLQQHPNRKVLIDGFVMKSKYKRKEHATRPLNANPPGWGWSQAQADATITTQYMIDEWTQVLENRKSGVHQIGSDRAYFILIQDEPMSSHHYFLPDEVELLADVFRDVLNTDGHQFYMGITITRGHAMLYGGDKDYRGWPQNLDYVYVNYYPWTSYGFGQSKLNDLLDRAFDNMKEYFDTSRTLFGITGQGYYGNIPNGTAWTQPPNGAPEWYAQYIVNDPLIDGFLIWLYNYGGSNNITALDSIPELYQKYVEAFNEYYT